MTTTPAIRRIATYERVSSEDQKLRETIKNQTEQLARSLQSTPGVVLVDRYVDDGVSGTVPMAKRRDGRRLLEDAAAGRFDEVWVYKIDRLGRDEIDPLIVWRDLEALGVKVHSVTEGVSDTFMYTSMWQWLPGSAAPFSNGPLPAWKESSRTGGSQVGFAHWATR